MKISIIIPIFNQKKYSQKCLESIFSCGSKYSLEIIVVDNASTDGSGEYLMSLGKMIVVVHNEKNLGFASACNQGAKTARGEYLLFLNNDTAVTKDWLDILVKELDDNENVAIVGPKLLYLDNTIQHAGIVFKRNKQPYHIYHREKGEQPHVNKKRRFQCLTAACLLIRSTIFGAVNGFEESYINGYEDVDLCLKVGELGFGVLYCPESLVYHYGGISTGRHDHDEDNRDLFLKRWGQKIKIDYADFLAKDGTRGYRRSILGILRKLTPKNL